MKYGTVRVTTPDGQVREYPLDAPTASIGRSPENRIVIDHPTVARRHARVAIDSGLAFIEALGGDGGAFVGSEPLGVGDRRLWGDAPLRLGDVELRFLAAGGAPAPAAPVATASPAAPASVAQPIMVTLQGPNDAVAPGSITTATLTIQNRGSIVDEVNISVRDLPAGWTDISRTVVPLLPGAREEVTITFRPPRANDAVAGPRPFTVAASSRAHGIEAGAVGTLAIQSFSGFTVELQPVRAKRDFRVEVVNTGNAPLALSLEGVDDEGALRFDFERGQVRLGPGERTSVPLRVKMHGAPKLGREFVRPFRVEARPADTAVAASAVAGQLRVKPPLEAWRRPALALIVLAALGGGGATYATKCNDWSLPGCRASEPAAAAPDGTASPGPMGTAAAAATASATVGAVGASATATASAAGGDPPTPTMTTTGDATATPTPATTAAPTTPAMPTTPAPWTPSVGPFDRPDRVLIPGLDYLATVHTTAGSFVIDLDVQGNYDIANSFAFLALAGFYDGMPFAVYPDRVDSGDPEGHGLTTGGYLMPATITRFRNRESWVGATPFSRDVEQVGSGWYVNLIANEAINPDHPVFGVVSEGMDIVRKLTNADTITGIDVVPK